jgi:hypothetical protein
VYTTDWNDRDKAEEWRRAWAAYANAALRLAGKLTEDNVLDHRSYERQGLEIIPTVHLGVAAMQMERRGISTERGDMNRAIVIGNREIRQLRARISHLQKWVADEEANNQPPKIAEILTAIMSRQDQSSLTQLKIGSEVFNFLYENDILSLEDLKAKVNAMQDNLYSVSNELKKVDRRINTLKEHLRHSKNFKSYHKIKARYEALYAAYKTAKKATGFGAESKTQKALSAANEYYEANRPQLGMYDNAEKYLRDVLHERFYPKKLPPISMWEKELTAKTAERETL